MIQDEIKSFCKLNDIADVDVFTAECLVMGFNMKKYGHQPAVSPQQTHQGIRVGPITIIPKEQPVTEEKITIINNEKDDYELYD